MGIEKDVLSVLIIAEYDYICIKTLFTVQEFYHKWLSQYIGREYEMLVFGTNGYPVIFFPPANGRFYAAKDNNLINTSAELLQEEKMKIYCPDSYDSNSWYNFTAPPEERVKAYKNFEQLIIYDIIGFTRFETQHDKVILAGCGFGGYHAVNFTLKHPDMVSGLLAINGFYNIKQFIYGYYDDDCYFNNPPDYLPGLTEPWYIDKLKEIEIFLACSENDLSVNENRELSSILESKGIKNRFSLHDKTAEWETCDKLFVKYISEMLRKA